MTESTYVSDPADWSDPENHIGGFYELEINLGPASEDRMSLAVEPLWAAAALGRSVRSDGVGGWVDAEPSLNVLLDGSLSGAVEIPGLGRTLWRVLAFRESLFDDEGELIGYGEEALILGLPLGALGRLDPRVGPYPFGDVSDSDSWRAPIEAWFRGIIETLVRSIDFEHALSGFEVFGDSVAECERMPEWCTVHSGGSGSS